MGSSPRPGNIFSIYLIEELNQKVNINNNKNSSKPLVIGHWPETKIGGAVAEWSEKFLERVK